MYAAGMLPRMAPKTAQRAASLKPRKKTLGPSMPKVILFAAILIEFQRRKACR